MGDHISDALVGVVKHGVIQPVHCTGLQGIQHLRAGDHHRQGTALLVKFHHRFYGGGADFQSRQIGHFSDRADNVAYLAEAVAEGGDSNQAVLRHNLRYLVRNPAIIIVGVSFLIIRHQSGEPSKAQRTVQYTVHGHVIAHQHIQRAHLKHLGHIRASAQRTSCNNGSSVTAFRFFREMQILERFILRFVCGALSQPK